MTRDTGHYNCRDYHISPDETFVNQVLTTLRIRKESNASPLNKAISRPPPSFQLLALPLEIRQKIYSYLLPATVPRPSTSTILQDIFTGFQRLSNPLQSSANLTNVIWQRGQTSLLCVSRQLHEECASLLYGSNPFVLFVTYDTITFRFRWILPSSLTPSRSCDFLNDISRRYVPLIKQVVLTIDHVDSYTGMIKHNTGGNGLTHGLRCQVQKLVDALCQHYCDATNSSNAAHSDDDGGGRRRLGLNKLTVRLLNGNDYLDSEKRRLVKAREDTIRGVQEVQTVLSPLTELRGLKSVSITGAVTADYAETLRSAMVEEP